MTQQTLPITRATRHQPMRIRQLAGQKEGARIGWKQPDTNYLLVKCQVFLLKYVAKAICGGWDPEWLTGLCHRAFAAAWQTPLYVIAGQARGQTATCLFFHLGRGMSKDLSKLLILKCAGTVFRYSNSWTTEGLPKIFMILHVQDMKYIVVIQ
jgi:hypothetical protein